MEKKIETTVKYPLHTHTHTHTQGASPLTAAALQDHLSRRFSLNNVVTSTKKRRGPGRTQKCAETTNVKNTACSKCSSKGIVILCDVNFKACNSGLESLFSVIRITF